MNESSVQIHLSLIQNVIQRMALNSTSCKTWCITIVSAILIMVADKSKPDFTYIALLPIVLFCCMDAYYLSLEKGFRNSYNDFINKLHNNTITLQDLYIVEPLGNASSLQIESLKSYSIWGFYVTLIVLTLLTKYLIIYT